jgi:hypothetical protein
VVFVAQVLIAIGYLVWYDRYTHPNLTGDEVDLTGILEVKRHLKRCLGITDGWSVATVAAAISSLGTLLFLVSVPTLFLCYRREGERGFKVSGAVFILGAVIAKTILYYKANVTVWHGFKISVQHMFG